MPVCVAGMHRSGTSMVTNFLQACGLYLGPFDDIMPAAPENPEGFWENFKFVEVNEEILNQLGGGWDCPPPEPDDWTSGRLAPIALHAETIIEHFVDREPWGWKDPRTSLTIPFWQKFFPDLRVVIVVRNPLEVALSLRKRNGFSFALGLSLWYVTYRRVLDATTAENRIVTHYDAYFGDVAPEMNRLTEFVRLPSSAETIGSLASASSLRHHRLTTEDLIVADVSTDILSLYRELCEEAEWRDTYAERAPAAPVRQQAGADTTPETPNPFTAGVGGLDRAVMELRVTTADLEETRRSLTGREERVEELEAALHVHEMERAQKDQSIDELTSQVDATRVQKDQITDELTGRLEILHAEFDMLHGALNRMNEERNALQQEAGILQRTTNDQSVHLGLLNQQVQTLRSRESELRSQVTSAHEQLVQRDSEIVGSLGAALLPYAPGAPAAIYYRQLLKKVRELVAQQLPEAASLLVVNSGDDLMLEFDGKRTIAFPQAETDGVAAYSPLDGATAIAQLQQLQRRGADYLVIPASGYAWLARHPDFKRYLDQNCAVTVRDEASVIIYALGQAVSASA